MDGLVVRSVSCSSKGPYSGFQHRHKAVHQLPVTPTSENPIPSSGLLEHPHIYGARAHTHTHLNTKQKRMGKVMERPVQPMDKDSRSRWGKPNDEKPRTGTTSGERIYQPQDSGEIKKSPEEYPGLQTINRNATEIVRPARGTRDTSNTFKF